MVIKSYKINLCLTRFLYGDKGNDTNKSVLNKIPVW